MWTFSLSGHKVLYQCDNSSVVAAICKDFARDATVMQLLHSLWFFTAHYDIDLACTHIAGVANTTADHLSRNNSANFFTESTRFITTYPTASLAATDHQHPRTGLDISQMFISTINKKV